MRIYLSGPDMRRYCTLPVFIVALLTTFPLVAIADEPSETEFLAPVYTTGSAKVVATGAATRRYRDPIAASVEQAISTARRRYLNGAEHTPWQIMHGLLGLRYGFYLKDGNKLVHGLTWISAGQKFEGSSWFESVENGGRAHPFTRPYAFQGHANQFLAIISMAGIPLNHKFHTASGEVVTVQDMVEHAKNEISAEDELAWTLWSLSRYLPPDATWTNKDGEQWSIERIVETQVRKPINNRTYCGGTHCLFALAHARNIYMRSGKPLRGVWLEADQKVKKHVHLARSLQNRDGMFSTDYFNSRKYNQDFSERIASAGHILEFLMVAVSQRELQKSWIRKGVLALSKDLITNANSSAKCGPLYHTVDGLVVYLDRTQPGAVRRLMARSASSNSITPPSASAVKKPTVTPSAPIRLSIKSEMKVNVVRPPADDDSGTFVPPIDTPAKDWKSRQTEEPAKTAKKPLPVKAVSSTKRRVPVVEDVPPLPLELPDLDE